MHSYESQRKHGCVFIILFRLIVFFLSYKHTFCKYISIYMKLFFLSDYCYLPPIKPSTVTSSSVTVICQNCPEKKGRAANKMSVIMVFFSTRIFMRAESVVSHFITCRSMILRFSLQKVQIVTLTVMRHWSPSVKMH